MAALTWDNSGEKIFETGIDHVVLYVVDDTGAYGTGVAWNGVTTITEQPTGASPNPQYADNLKYVNLLSAEDFGLTINAFTYPEEFGVCDGSFSPSAGLSFGMQGRKLFGLSYRTLVGNDVQSLEYGYRLHMVWGCLASPAEKAYTTVNESPSAAEFSWTISTTPIAFPAGKPTAHAWVDSIAAADKMATLEQTLYGGTATATLPTPTALAAMFATA